MAQAQRVKTTATPIEPIAPAPPEPVRAGTTPWMLGALIGVTVALLALAGWTIYQRYQRGRAEHLASAAIAAWDSAKPLAFVDVYDPKAVVIASDGTSFEGLGAIEAAANARGPSFSIAQTGGIAVNGDGSYATVSYRFAGDGKGTGVTILQIRDGKVVRQWNYDTTSAVSSAKK